MIRCSDGFVLLAAIKDFESAKEHSENDRQIKEGLERAHRLLKQSKKRDYYKILGVKRLDKQMMESFTMYFQCRGLTLISKLVNVLIKLLWLQNCPKERDPESIQKVGAAVASRQLPGWRRKEKGREEVYRHRSSQRSSHQSWYVLVPHVVYFTLLLLGSMVIYVLFFRFSAEMRSKFDQGEDPMDPESQQGGGHHHHHFHGGWDNFQGFNPFGSGPFNFKFGFN